MYAVCSFNTVVCYICHTEGFRWTFVIPDFLNLYGYILFDNNTFERKSERNLGLIVVIFKRVHFDEIF